MYCCCTQVIVSALTMQPFFVMLVLGVLEDIGLGEGPWSTACRCRLMLTFEVFPRHFIHGSPAPLHSDVLLRLSRHALGRFWFNIGVVCFSVNVVILAYLTVWLPHVRGIKVSWNVYSPRAIPTATVVGLICAVA